MNNLLHNGGWWIFFYTANLDLLICSLDYNDMIKVKTNPNCLLLKHTNASWNYNFFQYELE